jgi:large subunit ribosomal protein L7/L12
MSDTATHSTGSAQAADKVTLSADEKKLIDALEKLNVVSLNTVVRYMEQEYGISIAPAAIAVAGSAAAGGDAGEAAEEKSAFDIELTETGGQKIAVIKVVREISGLGLGEAKAKVDGAPQVIKEGVPKEEAEAAKKKLEEAGAKVTLK